MIVRNCTLVFVIIFAISVSSCFKHKFSNFDLDIIGRLRKYFNAEYVVFVKDYEDMNFLRSIKTLHWTEFYYTVVNSSLLEKILENNVTQMNFLQRRTLMVTNEKLNLTSLLGKVAFPYYLIWTVFGDYTPDLYIPVSSHVIFVQSTSKPFLASQVYHLKRGTNARVNSFDFTDLEIKLPFAFKVQKINFHKVSMDMQVLNVKEACEDVRGALLMKKLECVHQDFLEIMGARLNFSINPVECMEKEHPFTYPNGTDSELFVRLKNREVDFSAISFVIRTLGKRNYMEFVWPTFVLKSRMYLKQGRLAGRWSSYLRPLETSVWWGILIWIVITGILIQIFEKLLSNQLKFNSSLLLDLVSSTLNALQVFCNQAMTDMPTSYSIRIIYFLKFFVVLIFFQAYCGYLISSLTIVAPHFPFKDLKGFFENQHYQIMALRKGFHQFYFRKVIGEGQRENFMLPAEDLPQTVQQAVDKLCAQKFLAFTGFREDLLNFNKLNCKISELPSAIVRLYVGIALPKKTPLKELLRRELLHLKATGLQQRLGTRLSSHSDFRDKMTQDEFATVSMTQIFSIFILLGMGIFISTVIFVTEVFTYKRKKSSPMDLGTRSNAFSNKLK